MSRTASPELLAHFAGGSTTRAYCWKCTRRDSTVFAFTSVDIPLVFDGVTYEAATGFTPSAIEGNLDLSVPNLEVSGMLSSDSITERDLLAGLWDGCEIEIFEVNFRDLSMGRMILGGGKIGNVSAGRVAFTAELRGLTQQLQQSVGDSYTKTCLAIFGDARCGFDVEALRVSGAVTASSSRAAFSTALAGADDLYGSGVVTWVTGANEGALMEVASFASGAFTLSASMPFNITAGDTFTVVSGCRKRLAEDCQARYSNVINFRGFPYVPLADAVLGQGGME